MSKSTWVVVLMGALLGMAFVLTVYSLIKVAMCDLVGDFLNGRVTFYRDPGDRNTNEDPQV